MGQLKAIDNLQSRADIWPVFICYRQSDGRRVAERIFHLLNGILVPQDGTVDSSPVQARLDVYFDQTAPAVGDWTVVQEPYLKRARAFILVCTPGARLVEGTGDWVHREIDWWIQNREQAPILIDALGTGERYVPDSVLKRWPNAQRIEVVLEETSALSPQRQEEAEKRTVARVLGGLTQSAGAVYREELKREQERAAALTKALDAQKRSSSSFKRAFLAAACLAVATLLFLGSGVYFWYLLQRTLGATYGATAQFLLQQPVTNDTAPVIAATAAEGWRLARTSDSWNALQRVPVVRKSPVIEQDGDFESYRAFDVSSQGNRVVVLSGDNIEIWNNSKSQANGHVRLPSASPIRMMALSPNGDVVATAGKDGSVRLSSMDDGHETREPLLRENFVLALAFSEDGKRLGASTQSGNLYVWNLAELGLPQVLRNQLGVVHLALCAATKLIATAKADGRVMILNLETDKEISRISAGPGLVGIAFSSDGRKLTVANDRGIARVFSLSGKELPRGRAKQEDEKPYAVALSRDGRYLATVVSFANNEYAPFEIHITSVVGEQEISLPYYDGTGFDYFAFAPDSTALLVGHHAQSGAGALGWADLWDFDLADREQAEFSLGEQVQSLALNGASTLMAIATTERVVRILNTFDGKEVSHFAAGGEVANVAISSDGSFLAVAGQDKKIRVWSIKDSRLLFIEEHKAEILDLMFSEDGQRLETVSADGVVNSTGPLPETKAKEVRIGECRTAKFSSNGSWLVCERSDADDFFADVIQMKTNRSSWTVSQWPFYEGYAPSAIAISDDGRMFAVGRVRGGTILCFAPQGASIHSNGKDEGEITSLRDRMATTMAFSHSGDLLITAEDDGTVRLTGVKDGQVKERARIQQSATVTALAIDQQGRIFTGGTSGSVESWSPDLDSMLKRLCNSPGVNLSRDQWKRSGYLDDVAWRPVCKDWP